MAAKRDESELVKLNLRMHERLRARIEADAEARGLSMNAAIVEHLEQSLREQGSLGGPRTTALLRRLAEIAKFEGGEGDAWLDSYAVHAVVAELWREAVEEAGPMTPPDVREAMNYYVNLLQGLEKGEIKGEYRERIVTMLGFAAKDVRLPIELRAQLAAVANVDIK